MEDATHGRLDGIVVEIDRFWVVCAVRGAEWLSGSKQGFDGFVAQDEERCHRPEAGQQRLVAAGVGGPAGVCFFGGVFFVSKNTAGGASLMEFCFLLAVSHPPPPRPGGGWCGEVEQAPH